MDIRRELQVIKNTGKLTLGYKETMKAMLHRQAKLVILAENCPPSEARKITVASEVTGIQVLRSDTTSLGLGSSSGKPFGAAVVAVLNPGNSSIMEEVTREFD